MQVEAYNREKSLQKVKRHPTLAKPEVSGPIVVVKEGHKKSSDEDKSAEMSHEHVELKTSKEQEAVASPATSKGTETRSVSSNLAIKGKTNDSGDVQNEVTGDVEMKDTPEVTKHKDGEKTVKDAVKPKKKKRKNKSS